MQKYFEITEKLNESIELESKKLSLSQSEFVNLILYDYFYSNIDYEQKLRNEIQYQRLDFLNLINRYKNLCFLLEQKEMEVLLKIELKNKLRREIG